MGRSVSVASKHFLTIRHLMKKRDLICVVPELMAQLDLFSEKLVHSEPPINVGEFDIQLIWQTRNKENKRYQWLKELLIQTIEKSVAVIGRSMSFSNFYRPKASLIFSSVLYWLRA